MVSCNDLLSLNIFKDIKIVAGKSGIYKNISWPYICQTLDFSQWVNGGELMFFTGMGMDLNDEKLINLIYECVKEEISGLVILTNSEYINNISDEVIKIADEEGLPLFDMPWNIKLIDVNKEIANYIMESNMNQNKEKELLRELLFSHDLDEESINNLTNQSEFRLDTGGFVAKFNLIESFKDIKMSTDYIINMIRSMMDKNNLIIILGAYDNCIVCIIKSKNRVDFIEQKKILKSIYDELSKYTRLSLSIGSIRNRLIDIRESYDEATKVFKLYKCNDWNLEVIDYDNIGFYKILFEINNVDKLKGYCNEVLGEIIDHDKNKNTNLLETLQYYLINNCNLIKTSKEMYIHRNTLVYRLNKIKLILDDNLEDPTLKNELINAIMITNYLRYIESE